MSLYAGRFPVRDYPIYTSIMQYLRHHEVVQDNPVRLLDGGGRTYETPSGARAEHLDALGVDRDTWNDSGITIYLYATISPQSLDHDRERTTIPQGTGLFEVGSRYDQEIRSFQVTPSGADGVEQFYLGDSDVLLGEYHPEHRHVALIHDARYWGYRYTSMQWSAVFDHVLRNVIAGALNDEARIERNIARFVAVARERNMQELNTIEQRIADNESRIVMSNQTIAEARTALTNDQELLDAVLSGRREESTERFRAEWEALTRHNDIENVRFVNRTLYIKTGAIPMTVPSHGSRAERTVNVGEFDLKIDFESNRLTATNLTERRGNRDHPHVRDGGFCLGELENTMARLIRERQIGAAANLAIDALKHVNPEDSWGRSERLWTEDIEDTGEYA